MAFTINKLRQQPAWIALIIFIALCLWVASGMLKAQNENDSSKRKSTEIPLVKVTVEHITADEVTREISLYGRTEPDRIATLRSEVKGLVEEVYVQEGERVSKGQKIISLEKSDYVSRLKSAKATLKLREVELKGAQSLKAQGYQSQSALAQATANLEMAKADMVSYQLAVFKSQIIAPFDGIINQRFVEVGDFLKEGDNIAILVDLDPLVITANVTEVNVQALKTQQQATGRMVSGDILQGKIRYISSISELGTNTFKIEVEVPNPNYTQMAGMSTELALPLETTWAMRISPAVMSLDEQGNLGVKIVVDELVKFVPIDIVKSDSQGVWLSGMGQQADIIILGHGFVRDGDKVEVVRTDEGSSSSNNLSSKAN
ncbi:efflux RND transporter periplasmic adaptor subunit [Paraglaciecola sp. MB-3u-78]|uniref:efflux RND transporter periplasmic adaptor subunit n=1 Tax=Paraglaciecola sp. MB-3u-78 TaxID=2058332 RepID=UPI000C335F86|nr:efflux RND transporter periplasmic adaptor subunit [Paraglaciecola sp. MB-3u-78]PKH00317.1 efflux RND transporter periplasmic adaptor subunit [Paraglaciecola sp. MB-3u-78]